MIKLSKIGHGGERMVGILLVLIVGAPTPKLTGRRCFPHDRRFPARGPADSLGRLLRLPRPRRQGTQSPPAARRPRRGSFRGPGRRQGRRARQAGRERAGPENHRNGSGRKNAASQAPPATQDHGNRGSFPLGCRRGQMARSLVSRCTPATAFAFGNKRLMAPQWHRHLCPGPAGERGLVPCSGGRPNHAHPPGHPRPDGPASDSNGSRRVPGRFVAGRLLEAGGPALAIAALWRAHGRRLAGRRPVCRYQRLPGRPRSGDVALARLGCRRFQSQSALRPLYDRAACGRPLTEPDARQRSPPACTGTVC